MSEPGGPSEAVSRAPRGSASPVAVVTISGLLTSALLFGLSLFPAPYVVQTPGPTLNTLGEVDGAALLDVEGAATYPSEGAIRVVTVSVRGGPGWTLDAVDVVRGWLTGAAVLPVETVYPPDLSEEELKEFSVQEMTDSQDLAAAAALTELGYVVPADLRVVDAVRGGAAERLLLPDDVLLGVDGASFETFEDLVTVMAAIPPGTSVTVRVQRAGSSASVPLTTGDDGSGGSVLGVYLVPEFRLPVDVGFRTENIGGPSAGAAFALGIYDLLTPGALVGTADVSVTGTISPDGDIGPIGAIRQKLRGAARDGSTHFLIPVGNCEEADGFAPAGLTVVPVASLTEAVDAAGRIGRGEVTDLPACPGR